MSAIVAAWNRFFFAEQSPLPLALFRIAYGLVVVGTLVLLKADWLTWYGTHAWVSLNTMRDLEPGVRLNLFTVIPQDDRWILGLFWIFLVSAILLTVGFLSRINTVIVYLCLTSIQQRNLYITHGGDTFLRVAGFFLIFAPAGAALSVDRLIRVWRGTEQVAVQARRLWAQRMIQIELSLVYVVTVCWKLKGGPWIDGSALFYVYHLFEFERFPIPSWFLHPLILKMGTWLALVLEFSLGTLIWVKSLRYKVLTAGLLFHLGLEYSLNIPMFQWDVLCAYILFVDAKDLERIWNWTRVRAGVPMKIFLVGGTGSIGKINDKSRKAAAPGTRFGTNET
jgi:Vitamin K-dependent gamma-carboxylase